MSSFPLWAAIRTVKARIGTWTGYERYTAVDPAVTREEWARAVGEARAAIANGVDEATKPLNRRPLPGEITPYTSKGASGFLQYVKIYVRDRETGLPDTRYWTMRTDTLVSRQSAITQGLARYEAATLPEGTFEGEQIIGASYAGTVAMTPAP